MLRNSFISFFQFYFFFLIKVFKNINFLIWFILLTIFLSLSLNIFLINIGGSNPAFFLLPTRVWNFGFGILAMLFFVIKKQNHTNLEIVFYISMILIGFYYNIPHLPENFIIIFFTFMLLKKNFPEKFFLDIIINNKFTQYIGLISFSLYLWHWPTLVFVEYYFVYEVDFLIKIYTLVLSIILSIISYHLVEINFRYKFKIKSLYKLLLISYILFISFFVFINLKKNISYVKNSPDFIAEASLTNFKCEINNYKFYKNKRGCVINKNLDSNKPSEIAIIGNSHAQMYVPSIKPHLVKNKVKAILLPMTGCLPTLDVNINEKCMKISNKYFLDYSSDENIKTVIIATTWWHEKIFNGKNFIDDPNHLVLSNSILNLINKLKLKNKNVFLVGPIQVPLYELPQNLSRLLKFNHINEKQLSNKLQVNRKIYDSDYQLVNSLLSEKLQKNYIQLDKIQCDLNKCYYSNEEGVYFADGSHISKTGAKIFTKPFEIIFE